MLTTTPILAIDLQTHKHTTEKDISGLQIWIV